MAAGTFVNTLGNGLFITVGALYLTRKVGISAAHLGIGLSIAAAVGLVAGVQLGQVADRRGHRELLVGLTIAERAGDCRVRLRRRVLAVPRRRLPGSPVRPRVERRPQRSRRERFPGR
jgi:hypothetical protein